MQRRITSTIGLSLPLFICLALALGILTPGTSWAGDPGVLKLMVTDCFDNPLDNHAVEVSINRPGYGEIDTDSGYTDNGYIEFGFSDLEDGDQARVSAGPEGFDVAHVYTYVANGDQGEFDIGSQPNGTCADGWWDMGENIIQCKCDE